jgi:hypothetical protein
MSGEAPAPESRVGAVVLGIFFLLFGICILLIGGGCTILWISLMDNASPGLAEFGLLLLSLVTAAGGIFSILFAIRLFRGPAVPARAIADPPE